MLVVEAWSLSATALVSRFLGNVGLTGRYQNEPECGWGGGGVTPPPASYRIPRTAGTPRRFCGTCSTPTGPQTAPGGVARSVACFLCLLGSGSAPDAFPAPCHTSIPRITGVHHQRQKPCSASGTFACQNAANRVVRVMRGRQACVTPKRTHEISITRRVSRRSSYM